MLSEIINKLFNRRRDLLVEPQPESAPLMPRAIDISGNIFHFRMPENFSRDMPAKPLKEFVDLDNDADFSDDIAELVVRWWDFRDAKFNLHTIGSMMLRMIIVNIPVDRKEDISSYSQLRNYVHEDLADTYAIKNKRLMEEGLYDQVVLIPDSIDDYGFAEVNGQTWMKHLVATDQETDSRYYQPLNRRSYLCVTFRFTKTDYDVSPEEYWVPLEEAEARILSSFYVEFIKSNEFEQKIASKNNQLLLQSNPAKLPRGMSVNPRT